MWDSIAGRTEREGKGCLFCTRDCKARGVWMDTHEKRQALEILK